MEVYFNISEYNAREGNFIGNNNLKNSWEIYDYLCVVPG